jgi:hypothetical protein
MRKIRLRGVQKMTDAAYVADARRWAGAIIDRERSGGRKMADALERAADRLGVERGVLWSLRYRPPSDIMVSVYMRLRAAYENECERQEAKLAHELMLAKAVGLDATTSRTVAQAEAFLAARDAAE